MKIKTAELTGNEVEVPDELVGVQN